MGEVELPLVEADVTIDDALKIMLNAGRSGLVTIHDNQHAVFTVDELVEELRESGNKQLSALTPSGQTQTDFAVISSASARSMIDVTTAGEHLAASMSATPVLCGCEDGHVYTRAQAQARNGRCAKHTPSKQITCD
jgi:hypothetical protein